MEGIINREELAVKLGERIKQIRLEKQLSQAELARRSGKDRQHLELIENSKVIPNIYTIYQIACALEISLQELFDW